MSYWIIASAVIPLVNVFLILGWAVLQHRINRIMHERLNLQQKMIESLLRIHGIMQEIDGQPASPADITVSKGDNGHA